MNGKAMIEYTSLDVSKRLAETGFEAPEGFDTVGYPFKWLERAPGDVDLVEGWHGAESGDGPIAYRADTLLAWLLKRGRIEEIFENVENNTVVSFDDLLYLTGIAGGVAKNLPDALGEVVLKVLTESKNHKGGT